MAGARIHEASPNKTFIYTMAFGVMASWAGVGPALALSVLEQQRLYQDDYSNKAPGIYETPSSFIIIAEVRCGKNERSIDQKSRFRARKQLFALISRERQKRLRASLDGLQALHSELLLRRFNRKGPSRFVSLSLKSGRQIHCRYREVIAVEKNAFSDFENVNHIPLQKLEHDRIEYFRELIGSKKLNKLSSHYRQAGLIDLSIVLGLNYLAANGFPSYNYATIGPDANYTITRANGAITGRKQAIERIRRYGVDCQAIKFLANEARGVAQFNLMVAAAPACSKKFQASPFSARDPVKLKDELSKWYPVVKNLDSRALVETAIKSYGMLRFNGRASYGVQDAVMNDRDKAFKLFSEGKKPKEIISRLTAYLSQLPLDWRAWNKLGAVLRLLEYPQNALSVHTQSLNVGGVNAETLAHISRDYELDGNVELAKLYAQEVIRGYYPYSDNRWALSTATNVLAK